MADRRTGHRRGRVARLLPYGLLIPIALLLGLAPFRPEPHLVEKTRMLVEGGVHRPVDVFDLVLHGSPLVLLLLRAAVDLAALAGRRNPEGMPPA